jgi:calcineurin-like phosphoesterase
MLPPLLERLGQETPYVVVDFHASATAEKQTLFVAADGLCSAVIGSHCRVQTADQRVLPGGTAIITDAGRTGSAASVGGSDSGSRIQEYLSGIPDWTREAWARPELQGVYLDIGGNGKALSIQRVRVPVPEMPDQGSRQDAGPQFPGENAAAAGNDTRDAPFKEGAETAGTETAGGAAREP